MKKIIALCAVAVALAFCQSASAADISAKGLNAMGLSSMQTISAQEGSQVRGKGIAIAGGISHASFPGQSATNFHFAASATTNAVAGGANFSVAGAATNNGFIVVGAAGGSIAFAK